MKTASRFRRMSLRRKAGYYTFLLNCSSIFFFQIVLSGTSEINHRPFVVSVDLVLADASKDYRSDDDDEDEDIDSGTAAMSSSATLSPEETKSKFLAEYKTSRASE